MPIGPNERRTITREDLGYYKSVVVGGVYEFSANTVDLRSPSFYLLQLKRCVDEHPPLSTIVRDQHTEKPFYEQVQQVELEQHIAIGKDLTIDEGAGITETKAIEMVLGSALDSTWSAERPPWSILVHPIIWPMHADVKRCFVAFCFSHALGDGLAGTAFHRTFLIAARLNNKDQDQRIPRTAAPSRPLSIAFDTAERLPISWGFLLGPLFSLLLPKFLANLLGLRPATSDIDDNSWLGLPMFFKPDDFQTQVKLLEIEDAPLQNVLRASRRNGSKFTATLHQAIIRALSRAIPASDAATFVSGTAVNMRGSVGVTEDEMGMFVTGYFEQHARNDSTGPFSGAMWAAAGTMTGKLAESAVQLQDQPIGLLRYAPNIRTYLTSKLGQRRDSSYEVSNLVAFTDAERATNCRITKMVFGQPSGVVSAPLVFSCVSVKGGSLMIVVNWQPGALGVARENESAFVDKICSSIRLNLEELE